jgi:hypothetical protein
MATVTLAESAKLALNELVAGVIENVITVNNMYEVLPFEGIGGNALAYNRENVLGDVQVLGVGGTVTAKAAATFTNVTSSLTTIIGDAEVNGLIQATRSADGNDQTAVQIASKAKSAGRSYQNMLINGTGAGDEFTGLISLCAASQKAATGINGGPLSFAFMDELMSLVTDKDGVVDYFAANDRTIRSFLALLRALGGASISDVIALPSGKTVPAYRGTPIFRNDYIPINQSKGTGSDQTTMFAGTFDDGSMLHGISGLTARESAGMMVEDVGIAEGADNHIYRVKWYAGLALFSEKGLSCAEGITN